MLRWRLILGAVIIAVLAVLCWLDYGAARPGMLLFPLALVVAGLAAGEMVRLQSNHHPRPLGWVIVIGTLLVVSANAVVVYGGDAAAPNLGRWGWPMIGLAAAVILAFLSEMRRYERPGPVAFCLGLAMLAVVYVGVLFCFVIQLRLVGMGPIGMIALLSLIVVVKLADIGAYTVGRLIGTHKMAPVLSPGKTWEGAAGALVFGCLGSYLVLHVWLPRLELAGRVNAPSWGWIVYGVAIAIVGLIGDLAESLLKRDAGVKDSSDWMPGFGGVLDIVDSILLAAPLAYLLWITEIVG